MKKVLIIGLDCATPQIFFKENLPNIQRLMKQSQWGTLRSIVPPITTPAWMCMMTGRDPGALGVYGFRHRRVGTYDKLWIADGTKIKAKKVWDILGRKGYKVGLIGVPQTYPPYPINGFLVSCFLTPDIKHEYTYPKEFKDEIKAVVGDYILDVDAFRVADLEPVIKQVYAMTEKRFKLLRHCLKNKEWDFMMMVEMGPDRMQHGLWKRKFSAIKEYYQYLDKEMGETLKILDNDTVVYIVSDHGAKEMKGCFCINEWLIKNGYLVLNKYPARPTTAEKLDINWSKTKAWGWGGYYSRIFLNVRGREPQGIIEQKNYSALLEELKAKLKKVPDDKGKPMKNLVVRFPELYKNCQGDPADLLGIFGDLAWRAVGTVGYNKVYIYENDTGPDDAVHDWEGIYLKYDPQNPKEEKVKKNILQIKDEILEIYKKYK